MVMRAVLGGLEVVLRGTAVARVAPYASAGSLSVQGELFERVETEAGCLLVGDRRRADANTDRAYVECWRPVRQFEGDLRGLILLCDARPDDLGLPEQDAPLTLGELVHLLQ